VKRIVRFIWVLAANGFVAGFTILRLSAALSSRESSDAEVWLDMILEVLVPILGVILEGIGWKFAKWVNVGCLTIAGFFWLAEAIWWHSDPFFGVLLILSLGMLTLAGLTALVYRGTKSWEPQQSAP
jgi:uncharacterized membrane protein YqaE (UPF0057 family)